MNVAKTGFACHAVEAITGARSRLQAETDDTDLGILLAVWGTCEGDADYDPAADVDRDGCVNLPDLGILLADWGCGKGE